MTDFCNLDAILHRKERDPDVTRSQHQSPSPPEKITRFVRRDKCSASKLKICACTYIVLEVGAQEHFVSLLLVVRCMVCSRITAATY